jgi:hypothetical protein
LLEIYGHNGTSFLNALTVTNAGNVGIGTTSPAEKLHVIGNVRIDDAYKLLWSDVNLYRSAADVLKTDDNFDALALRIGGTEVIDSSRNLKNVSASVSILTDLPLHVAGDDTEISTTSTSYPTSDQKYFNLNLFAGAYSFSRLLASIEGKATSGYQLTVGIYVDGSLAAEISWTETSYKLKTATISLSGLDPTVIHQVGIRLKVTGGTGYVRTVDFCLVR